MSEKPNLPQTRTGERFDYTKSPEATISPGEYINNPNSFYKRSIEERKRNSIPSSTRRTGEKYDYRQPPKAEPTSRSYKNVNSYEKKSTRSMGDTYNDFFGSSNTPKASKRQSQSFLSSKSKTKFW